MRTTGRHQRSAAAAGALVLAGCAALAFAVGDAIGFADPTTEAAFTGLWLVGWALLAWATIVGGVLVGHLIRDVAHGHRPARLEAVFVVATAGVIAAVISARPLAGSGAGVGV